MANEDKASRYHRLRRAASIAGTALTGLLLIVLLMSRASAALREVAALVAHSSFTLTVVIYVVLLALLIEIVGLPLDFYTGVTLERRYDLSTQSAGAWWRDHLKATLIGLMFGVVAAVFVWRLLRSRPDDWWLIASLAFSAVTIALAQLAPVVLLPIFYDFKPLDRPGLRDRLVALAERAGARVLGVFEWRLSDRTRKSNAALTGLGRTRRILLSDTLLEDHSDDEIEVILAHELAHHVHRDMWTGMAAETALMLFGFFVADRVLTAGVAHFGITDKADVAALPLLALAGGAASIAVSPLGHALSRAHERRADRYALEMTRNAGAFVTAMKRLGARNLAEEHPSKLVELLFYTHPPLTARIEAAQRWAQAHTR